MYSQHPTTISLPLWWIAGTPCWIYHCANAQSYPRHWDDWSAIHARYIAVPMHIHIPGTGMISQQFMLDISLCQCTFISQALGWLVSNTCSIYHFANAHVFPASYHHIPATVMNSWHSMLDISLCQCTVISQALGWLVSNTCSIYHCAKAQSYPRHWDD
jgi:hypothetical protein